LITFFKRIEVWGKKVERNGEIMQQIIKGNTRPVVRETGA